MKIQGGKFWIENIIVDEWLCKLSGNTVKVLLKITRYYNKYGKCFPSIRRMSQELKMHHETVSNCIKELNLHGFFDQLEIRERYKLRYVFSKSARFMFPKYDDLLQKPDSKEATKEVYKEVYLNKSIDSEEGFKPALPESLKISNPELYEKIKNKLNTPIS